VKLETRSALILLLTLLLGVLLGGVATGAAARQRDAKLMRMQRPHSFAENMRTVIQPESDAQWERMRPVLEATARRNEQIRHQMREQMRMELDSMRARLDTILTPEQRERLAEFARRAPPPPGFGHRTLRHPDPSRPEKIIGHAAQQRGRETEERQPALCFSASPFLRVQILFCRRA
jgi:hypothetical protein